jgi:hypothetical protein
LRINGSGAAPGPAPAPSPDPTPAPGPLPAGPRAGADTEERILQATRGDASRAQVAAAVAELDGVKAAIPPLRGAGRDAPLRGRRDRDPGDEAGICLP